MLQLKDNNSGTIAVGSGPTPDTPVYCDCACTTTVGSYNPYKPYNIYYPDDLMKHKLPGSITYLDENKHIKEAYVTKVLYSNPATIVFWSDGTKTVSKCHAGDAYSPEAGLVLCILKKTQGKTLKGLFEAWIPYDSFSHTKQNIVIQTLSNVRKLFKKK